MQNRQNETTETAFMHQMANILTGGTYGMIRFAFTALFNVNTMLLMVPLRKNMGNKILKNGTWLFASTWLTFLFFCSVFTAVPDPETGHDATLSAPLIFGHGLLYIILISWRKFGAWRNLRNAGKEGVRTRHSYDIGESLIYGWLRPVLEPIGLIDDEVNPKTFWKLNEARWMQFHEPLLFFCIGILMTSIGFGVYGKFIMFASVCLFITTFKTFDNMARMRQAQQEAEFLSRVSNPEPETTKPHVID